jgi:hypothetical protein
MRRVFAVATISFLGLGPLALANPGHGDLQRSDVGRGTHPEGGAITFGAGTDTVAFTLTLAPGATSGWHRHPGAVVLLVKSGVPTTYGLSRPPCVGADMGPNDAYFEKDASTARWPHFVRNLGKVPTEAVVFAFNVPRGGSPRTEADAPAECADPTDVGPPPGRPSQNAAAVALAVQAFPSRAGSQLRATAVGPARMTVPRTGQR